MGDAKHRSVRIRTDLELRRNIFGEREVLSAGAFSKEYSYTPNQTSTYNGPRLTFMKVAMGLLMLRVAEPLRIRRLQREQKKPNGPQNTPPLKLTKPPNDLPPQGH